ncbi:MAG: NADH-quinone oxidoreductase subunit M [Phycisphaerae bacterium]
MSSFGANLLILLPILAAIAVWMLPERRADAAKAIALWVGVVTGVIAIAMWLAVPFARVGSLVGEFDSAWIVLGNADTGGVSIRYHVGVDAISGPLLALTGLLVPISIACSFTAIRSRQREYYAWLLALTAGMFGVFLSRDVILFYIFFEFTLVPLYFLIGVWGGSERRRAANMFFLYTFVGSVITFAGIMYLAVRAAQLSGTRMVSFDLAMLSTLNGLSFTEQSWLFLAMFCGFAIKVPFFPLHTWLPLAHTEAPTAGSVLLAGILLKLGTYGFLRFALPMAPQGAVAWADEMAVLAVAGIIYGALCSWVQRDVKKLVAYSSVSHLGFCMLGMFSMLPVGLSGSVLYMINHGLSTGALFLVVGMIYERYHTRDMDKIGGLARQMPILTFFLVLFTLSSVGLPGLNGFVSEFTTLFAAFNSPTLGTYWYGAVGAAGILLGAIYMLYMVGKVLFGPLKEPPHTPDLSAGLNRDLNSREIGILAPLAAMCVVLGVAPRIVTDSLDPILNREILPRVAMASAAEGVSVSAATVSAASGSGAPVRAATVRERSACDVNVHAISPEGFDARADRSLTKLSKYAAHPNRERKRPAETARNDCTPVRRAAWPVTCARGSDDSPAAGGRR